MMVEGEGAEVPNESTYILKELKKQPATSTDVNRCSALPANLSIDDSHQVGDHDGSRQLSPSSSSKEKGALVQPLHVEQNSMLFTGFIFLNSVIGPSIMGMPYVFNRAGLVPGILLMVAVGAVADVSILQLIDAGRISGTTTYQETVEAVFGRPGFVISALIQFCFAYLTLIECNILVGDTITKLVILAAGAPVSSPFVRRELITTLATFLITLPLSSLRDMAHLSNVSLSSIGCILFICVVMLVRVPDMMTITEPYVKPMSLYNTGWGSALGIISFAFVDHHASFMLYASLRDNTQQRWGQLTHACIATSLLLKVVTGVAGVLPFSDLTQGDIMENYCREDDLMNACRAVFSFFVLLTYPTDCFVCREVIETTFFRKRQPQPQWRRLVVTAAIVISTLLLSFTTDCIALVMQLNGIFFGLPLAFILPSVTMMRASGQPLLCRAQAASWVVLVFGVLVSVVSLANVVIQFHTEATCSHGREMDYCFTSSYNGTKVPVKF